MSKTIGDLIQSNAAAGRQSQASDAAAIQADQKATDDRAAYASSQATLATGLGKSGPITVPNGDGTFSTFEVSTTAPGFRVELSRGAETVVEDDPVPDQPPAPDEPA